MIKFLMSLYVLIFFLFILCGCCSTKESTVKETTITIKDVTIPVAAIEDTLNISFDTTSNSYTSTRVTKTGDSILIKITEKPVKNNRPVLHTEIKVTPAPVKYKDTTSVSNSNKQITVEISSWQKILNIITSAYFIAGICAIAFIIGLFKLKNILI